jgi:hypothetical protein
MVPTWFQRGPLNRHFFGICGAADEGPCQAVLESYLASGLSRSIVFASGDGAMDRTHV